uniref:Uncharacterized protein n=1 Tax=Arundo donax TaxID=35708 RepID=A0A0A9HRG4_ARUDO
MHDGMRWAVQLHAHLPILVLAVGFLCVVVRSVARCLLEAFGREQNTGQFVDLLLEAFEPLLDEVDVGATVEHDLVDIGRIHPLHWCVGLCEQPLPYPFEHSIDQI